MGKSKIQIGKLKKDKIVVTEIEKRHGLTFMRAKVRKLRGRIK